MENITLPSSEQHNFQLPQSGTPVKRSKKKIIIAILILCLILGAFFYFKSLVIAATVNGSPIMRLSVIRQLEKQGGKNVLDALITEKLINNEAAKQKIVVSDDEINQEIKNIEANIVKQGGTLKDALAQRGLTEEVLKIQIKTQKEVEKLLGDKVQVTEEEMKKFISDNKISVSKEQEAEMRKQVGDQIRGQKLREEAQKLISTLKTEAKITYYVTY